MTSRDWISHVVVKRLTTETRCCVNAAHSPKHLHDKASRNILFSLCGRNVIHGSDSVESAQKEIYLWFRQHELQNWENSSNSWIYS